MAFQCITKGALQRAMCSSHRAPTRAAFIPRSLSAMPTPDDDGRRKVTVDTINPKLKDMQYAVRGKITQQAAEMEADPEGLKEANIDHILYTNIGNPQAVGQKPLTWPRQVMALCDLPNEVGIDHPDVGRMFPKDVVSRAREIKKGLGNKGTGAYTQSQGALCFREDISRFLEDRDGGVPASPEHIFITNGASQAIDMILTALIADETCGVMIPIPQYPIYSAYVVLKGGQQVQYFLDEESGWKLNVDDLEKSLEQANKNGTRVTSFVLINPGNPTGQVLSKKDIEEVCLFCAKHNLVLLADEVYQENVYDENDEFVSCKKAAAGLGLLDEGALELVSFHSTSKGIFGECGRRGGFMEIIGMNPEVEAEINKLASSNLCPSVGGQIMTSLMARGPVEGDESFDSHEAEKTQLFESLQRRAESVSRQLNEIDGFSCQPTKGAMYCFPSVTLPKGAEEAAAAEGTTAEAMYCLSLLKSTGICVVPAGGFQQKPGRSGFRTTFLPAEEEVKGMVGKIEDHYKGFLAKYS